MGRPHNRRPFLISWSFDVALKDIQFSDLYISSDVAEARMRSTIAGDDRKLLPLPDLAHDDLRKLFALIESHARTASDDTHFSVPFEDVIYRVQTIRDVRSRVYALRRSAAVVPLLSQCGVVEPVTKYLMSLRAGLVIVAGGFGTGKTTTVSAYVRELAIQGSMVITLEDPPELPLSGDHGEGRILQVNMKRSNVDQEIEDTLRMAFDVLFLSEIRTPAMAAEVVKASINGKLIVSTLHADSAANAVSRLVSLAAEAGKGFGEKGARETLASGLAAVVYMAKISGSQRAATEYLLGGDSARGKISSGEYAGLQNLVNATRNRLNMGESLMEKR